MEVACARCKSEYEFDDALISANGTRVFCTNCGHKFQVFPPAGSSQNERWTLLSTGGGRRSFESLRELQRAIGRGEVGADDRLSRGEGEPRPIRTIVELAPLLNQPRSVPPPRAGGSSVPPNSTPGVRARSATRPLGTGKPASDTVIGLSPPKLPRIHLEAPPPLDEFVGESREDVGTPANEPVVPASPEDRADKDGPDGPAKSSASASEHRRVFSMLSTPEPAPAREDGWEPPVPTMPEQQPRITDAGDPVRPGAMTPTPPLSGRVSLIDSEPISKIPGTYRGRGARGVWVLLAVLVGAAAFLLATAKDKLPLIGAQDVGEAGEQAEVRAARLLDSAREVQADAEEAWLGLRLLEGQSDEEMSVDHRRELQERLRFRLRTLADLIGELSEMELAPAENSELRAQRVHLHRMRGELEDARGVVSEAEEAELPDSYALAMLDLAEETEDRPFSIILSRLKEASTGERGRFLVRSAYIYAQILAGRHDQARADLAALSQLKGGKSAPLFSALQSFLEEREERAEPGQAPQPGASFAP